MNRIRIEQIIRRLDYLKSVSNRPGGLVAYEDALSAFWPELRDALVEAAKLKGVAKN